MTAETTLSFTDSHHHFLSEKVVQGMFATQSAAVAAALEQMMQDEDEREVALRPSGRKSAPAWKRRAQHSSTRTMHSPLLVAPSAQRVARDLPDQVRPSCRA